MLQEFFLGFMKIHILYHASQERVYGAWLLQELARHGYRLGPSTLYPALHSLERKGYLECSQEVVAGKVRKYYLATAKGREALAEARLRAQELVAEVLEQGDERAGGDMAANSQESHRR